MPGKISEMGVMTAATAALTDKIEVLDVSDLSMAPTGTNKGMAYSEVIAFLNANGVGGGGRGVMALAKSTGTYSFDTSPSMFLSVSWDADPTRMYRTSVYSAIGGDTNSTTALGLIAGFPGTAPEQYLHVTNINTYPRVVLVGIESGLSGPQTRGFTLTGLFGSGWVFVGYDGLSHMLVEDIGAA